MSASMEKPVILLAHGSWHRPIHFLPFSQRLREEGYTVVAPAFPSCGWQDLIAGKTLEDDAEAIRAAMRPHLDAGREIIIAAHSYGSLPSTNAVPGNTLEERKEKGQKGGVRAILHIAAVLAMKAGVGGLAQFQLIPNGPMHYVPPPTWWKAEDGIVFVIHSGHPEEYLFNDIDPDLAAMATQVLVKQTEASFRDVSRYSVFDAKVPQTYVLCENDKGVIPQIQEDMVSYCQTNGLKLDVVRLKCGHAPFLKPKETEVLVDILKGL